MDFGQHGALLSQPLIAPPSMDSRSIQTDEKDLAPAERCGTAAADPGVSVTVASGTLAAEERKSSSREDAETERHSASLSSSCVRADRCYNVTLILLAVSLVVIASVALPLWLVPSGTGTYTVQIEHSLVKATRRGG